MKKVSYDREWTQIIGDVIFSSHYRNFPLMMSFIKNDTCEFI